MNTTAQNAPRSRADVDIADVDRVLGGDVGAFEGIVRRWQGPLVNMAWRYCRDRGRAEELAQEAFVRAWRGLASWRRESSFSTWLFALAANVFRNELKRFPTVSLPIEGIAEPSQPADQLSGVEERSQYEVVRRAVLALPSRYRGAGGAVLFSRQGRGCGGADHGTAGGYRQGEAVASAGVAATTISAARKRESAQVRDEQGRGGGSMTDERIDEILGAEGELVPSSGFLASVMERVREEAAAPPPIPFPWKRALPGFVVAAGVFGWASVEFAKRMGPLVATSNLTVRSFHLPATAALPLEQAGWVVAALAVSMVSWMLARRVAR